jgi:hypothetical protein
MSPFVQVAALPTGQIKGASEAQSMDISVDENRFDPIVKTSKSDDA